MTSADLRFGRWQDVLEGVECDALIVDAPYSSKTHAGHDSGTQQANALAGDPLDNRKRYAQGLDPVRRELSYGAWELDDVNAFVASWAPRTRGWFVTITDHVLAPIWADALEAAGRYVFSPLAFVAPGSRVRMSGDGPAQWSCWVIVARPASLSKWGALPGAYVVPPGHNGRKVSGSSATSVVGGKPLWLMQSLVRDYSRTGDLVCDPCAGSGSTLIAAVTEGRRAIGSECDPVHFAMAQKRLARGFTPAFDFGFDGLPDAAEVLP
jgi:hypothetical protein